MLSTDQTICLCMIVRNEAHVIRRCLASIRPIVDHWIVVDTGSRDGTQDIVRETMAGLPGAVIERPWRDFAHNRNEALALARPHGRYTLIMDADDELVLTPGANLPVLAADSYTIDILYNGFTYRRPQLIRNALAWRYRGVLHEFLECREAQTQGHLPIVMRINHEGARSTDPHTYAKDAAILEHALLEETDPFLIARYTFYLAQSYRDCGNREVALAAYLRRAEMRFWTEEVFVSLYQAGKLMEALGCDPEVILATYARASATAPSRVEAIHAASRFCRHLSRFAQGCALAEPCLGLPAPASGLFVEAWIYEYGLADEFAVNAYWAGRHRDCLDATLRALMGGKVPASEVMRFYANMRFALDKLTAELIPSEAAPVAATERSVRSSTSPPGQAPVPQTLHLGSGKDFRDEWLNVDIDASWSPDAVIDLSAVQFGSGETAIETVRFGTVTIHPAMFEEIVANDVLEHVPDLVALMTTCLELLRVGGVFRISVPYDLSLGAWQDPTHVRTFNERSWLYYTDWFWYLGWHEARFVVDSMEYVHSPLGAAMQDAGTAEDEIVRTPRAIDAMRVVLRKIALTSDDRDALTRWRGRKLEAATANHIVTTEQGVRKASKDEAGANDGTARPAFCGSWEANRDRFCVYVVSPAAYDHHPAFHDAAQALSAAFAALGGSAPVVTEPTTWKGRVPIVFGSHLLTHFPEADLPPEAVFFNLEPVDARSIWMNEDYLGLLKRHPVLDYSLKNIQALKSAGIDHADHLPIRAMPIAGGDDGLVPDIDVLFFGSINERRRAILDALRARGLNVVALFGVYGAERDRAVARAKVVLNVHFYEAAIFETVRVSPMLARGACVVSEGQPDDPDVVDLAGGLVLCSYETLVDHCCALVADAVERRSLSERARAAIVARPQSEILRLFFADAAHLSAGQ